MKSKDNNIDLWERVLNNPPESYKSWFKDEKLFLHKHITKNSKVLEVGCGDGRSIKDILEITLNIKGIDYDQKAVDSAVKNFQNYPNIKFSKAEATNLPFKDKEFDFVLCLTTFANFADSKYKAIEEMKRTLKDNGKIIISVFSEDAFEERMKIYIKVNAKIKEIINNKKVIFEENVISEQFSKSELIEIFNKSKLKVNEIIKSGIGYICLLSK